MTIIKHQEHMVHPTPGASLPEKPEFEYEKTQYVIPGTKCRALTIGSYQFADSTVLVDMMLEVPFFHAGLSDGEHWSPEAQNAQTVKKLRSVMFERDHEARYHVIHPPHERPDARPFSFRASSTVLVLRPTSDDSDRALWFILFGSLLIITVVAALGFLHPSTLLPPVPVGASEEIHEALDGRASTFHEAPAWTGVVAQAAYPVGPRGTVTLASPSPPVTV
ncbi:hypothetical protein FB451DRAFT_1395953 [Mycena latifolia]|nr:hypothetical protein FB451DRAFT_1395953 [Mycena latifolia]